MAPPSDRTAEAMGARSPVRPSGQGAPSRTNPSLIKPSKIAWICLVLFVRIGTFQRVTTEKIKNSLLRSFRLRPGKTLARSDAWERYSTNSDFRKKLRKEIAPALFAPPIAHARDEGLVAGSR